MRVCTPRRRDVLVRVNTCYAYRMPTSSDHELMIWLLRRNGKAMTYGKLMSEMRRIKKLQRRMPMAEKKDVVIGVGTPKGTGQPNPKGGKK